MSLSSFRFDRASTTLDACLRNLSETRRSRKQALSVCIDMSIMVVALWCSYSLRLGRPFDDLRSTWHVFLLLPAGTALIFAGLGIYRWVIRSTNRKLFRQIVKGALLSSVLLIVILGLLPPDRSSPRSLFVIYAMLLVLGSCGARLMWQSWFDAGRRGEPIAIYGAGAAGQQLASLLDQGDDYRIVAFIDDDRSLADKTVGGIRVIGGRRRPLIEQLNELEVVRVVLAMPSLDSATYQSVVNRFAGTGMAVQTMPGIAELVNGQARPDEIRDISIQDILGRQEVAPDLELMAASVTGKRVLVTGGGGSIGSELCRQIVELAPSALVIVDHCEVNLYNISEELEARFSVLRLTGGAQPEFLPLLMSVTDKPRIERLFAVQAIDTVFHAAAYKHVPIVERQPEQGVEVNVFGTLNVLDAAIANRVARFTFISTDKAVRPTNAMGASKRVAELVLQAKARLGHGTRISMVRFGNVLGSSGSVVPKFKQQILAGGPLTLTHKDITRYFMTIPEASQLVLQATAIARGGDVFVLDMGEPVKIMALAETMVRLYGKRLVSETGCPDDVEIRVEGLRPGEKLYEEMFIGDSHTPTRVNKVFTADEFWLPWPMVQGVLEEMSGQIANAETELLRATLLRVALLERETVDGKMRRSVPELAESNLRDLTADIPGERVRRGVAV